MTEQVNVDKNILAKVSGGDLKAFNELMVFFQRPIFNHLYRLTGNRDDAADLTQDTFLKVYKKRHQIDPEQNFRAWLYKVATNTAYDWFQKKKRQNEFNFSEETDIETIGQEVPYYRIEKAEGIDLRSALSRIKPKYQTVIHLYYQQGFTYEEIAGIIGAPLGTVKTLLFRAKKALEEELK